MKNVHFIGIAGKGMSATALLLREAGWKISGSDAGFYPPVSDYLVRAGVHFNEGYAASNIPADVDLIVIGKNAKLVPETNEEVAAAFASGKPIKSFPDVLSELTEGRNTIVVVGSYGKSTSTALLAWCLTEAEKDPSYFIGEVTRGFENYAHLGKSDTFILEGDEYPSANWDKTSKFLHYNAKNVLLTSATHDHFNIFPTHEDYLAPFRTLLNSLEKNSIVVANAGEKNAKALTDHTSARVVFYSLLGPKDWHASNIHYGMPTTFDLMRDKEKIIEITTTQLGAHNIENIVGASAMLLEKNLLSAEELARGINTFQGVKRRMEYLSPHSLIPVFEGFGSSYEKAKSAITATKLHFPEKRLVIVFEPDTISWRRAETLSQYDDVFSGASRVYIVQPPHDAKGMPISIEQMAARAKTTVGEVIPCPSAKVCIADLEKNLERNDVVLLLSSGAMGGLIESIPKLAETKFPA